MLDAVEALQRTQPDFSPRLAAEIGCGSGILSACLSKIYSDCFVFATDISSLALEVTKATLTANSAVPFSDVLQVSLLSSLRASLVDLLICNPPYVETSDVEYGEAQAHHRASIKCQSRPSHPQTSDFCDVRLNYSIYDTNSLAAAWAGGTQGLCLITQVLDALPMLLAPGGIFLLLLIDYNQPQQFIEKYSNFNFHFSVIPQNHYFP
jgi:methylase of polypeptide subunit release factors